MTTFRLQIEMNGPAFAEDRHRELRRILHNVASKMRGNAEHGIVTDIRGDTCGAFSFAGTPPAAIPTVCADCSCVIKEQMDHALDCPQRGIHGGGQP